MVRSVIGVAICALYLLAGCKAPEEKLAGHFAEIERLSEQHADAPDKAVESLRSYTRENLADMMRLAAEIIVEIDKADPSDERTERVKAVINTLEGPVKRVGRALEGLSRAVRKDEKARAIIDDLESVYGSMAQRISGKFEVPPEENPLVVEIRALSERLCACTDVACADGVVADITAFDRTNKGVKINKADNEAVVTAIKEATACNSKIRTRDLD